MSPGWVAREPLIFVTLLGACGPEPSGIGPRDEPIVETAFVASNPHNAISAVVTVRVRSATRVAIQVSVVDGAGTGGSVTPAVATSGDSAVVPVLGLLPDRAYVMRAIAYGGGRVAVGGTLHFTTASLPADLPRYTASGVDASPGFVVFAAGQYGLVIDNAGRVVWYRHFPAGPGLSFAAQPNGRYVTRPATADAADPGGWIELDPLGMVTRTLRCANGLRARLHDLIAEPDGSYWLLCDETRTMNLVATGGAANALVTGTVVQHVAAGGALLFSWNPFDHFDLTDVDASERSGSLVNWTHGNAIDLDADGNVIVSFRNLGEVTKIDRRTGNMIWRLGGRRNEFDFVDSPAPSFVGQHSVRVVGAGQLLLLDNIGDPAQSRAERFAIDERAHRSPRSGLRLDAGRVHPDRRECSVARGEPNARLVRDRGSRRGVRRRRARRVAGRWTCRIRLPRAAHPILVRPRCRPDAVT